MIRIHLEENGQPIALNEISMQASISDDEIMHLFQLANIKIKKALHLKKDPILCRYDKVIVQAVAGAIKLSNRVELEIIPKYLKHQSRTISWKEDFYLLSTMSKYGKLLCGEGIRSNTSTKSFLYDLAGRTLAEQYLKNQRQPLRKYRKEEFYDYSIDGDIVFESAFEIHPDGLLQEKINFDDRNIYNATILQAMKYVRKYISDPRILAILGQAIAKLSPQDNLNVIGRRLLVPNRDRNWTDTYNLSYDILLGMGSIYANGKALSPGFIASTWQIWEWLITTGITLSNKNMRVVAQEPIYFGEITKLGKLKDTSILNVYPDVTVYDNTIDHPKYLVDAKYKYLSKKDGISRTDIYEAYAFCKASGADMIFMIYPSEDNVSGDVGSIKVIQESSIDGKKIVVAKASMENIAQNGGIIKFSRNMVESINYYL